MLEWPILRNLKALHVFLGLTRYYTKFVKDYGNIAALLTKLLKKEVFQWGDEPQKVFKELKKAMTTVLVLALPNFS